MPGDKKHGLGKGMGSLLSGFDYDAQIENVALSDVDKEEAPIAPPVQKNPESNETGERVVYIDLSSIMANPNQPRKSFDEDSLNDLAESIKSQGVIQPIIVEEYAPGKFSIIAGERRFRAAQIAGLKNIPSIVKNLGEIQRMEVSLIENVQRENLNPVEEAFAYQYLIQKSGYTQEEVAKKVGKSRSAITNSIRLLNLPDTIKDDLISGLITSGHARAILSLVNPSDQMLLRNKIVEGDLSVREAEALADDYNKGRKIVQKKKEKGKDPEVIFAEEKFINAIGAKVEIKGTLNRGRLMVRFRTQKELERIYAYLSNGDDLFEE